jgi:hypothetical protein
MRKKKNKEEKKRKTIPFTIYVNGKESELTM